ncbi:hypothetical protein D3C72_880610 [compost metagenome]
MAEVVTHSSGRVTGWASRVSAPIGVLPMTVKPSTGASKVSLTPLGKLAPAASLTGADSWWSAGQAPAPPASLVP